MPRNQFVERESNSIASALSNDQKVTTETLNDNHVILILLWSDSEE
jgi:hypothetical protein